MASAEQILCPRCTHIRPRTAHHIFPREFWGPQPNGPFLYLCEKCHNELQKLVHHRSLSQQQILEITLEWLVYEEVYA